MIAVYDMTGWISVGLGCIVVVAVVVGFAIRDRQLESKLPPSGDRERASTVSDTAEGCQVTRGGDSRAGTRVAGLRPLARSSTTTEEE